jgi:hypothetical protein
MASCALPGTMWVPSCATQPQKLTLIDHTNVEFEMSCFANLARNDTQCPSAPTDVRCDARACCRACATPVL